MRTVGERNTRSYLNICGLRILYRRHLAWVRKYRTLHLHSVFDTRGCERTERTKETSGGRDRNELRRQRAIKIWYRRTICVFSQTILKKQTPRKHAAYTHMKEYITQGKYKTRQKEVMFLVRGQRVDGENAGICLRFMITRAASVPGNVKCEGKQKTRL